MTILFSSLLINQDGQKKGLSTPYQLYSLSKWF